jgi:hypothetical protein
VFNLVDNTIIQKYRSDDIYDAMNKGNDQLNVMMLDYKKKSIGQVDFHLK